MHTPKRTRRREYGGLAACGALIAICTLAIRSLVPNLALVALLAVLVAIGVTWFGLVIRDWWRELDTLLADDPMAPEPDEPEEPTWRP